MMPRESPPPAESAPPGGQRPAPHDPPPVLPAAPEPGDCCGEGCANCVLDLYDVALSRYEAALVAWRARQPD